MQIGKKMYQSLDPIQSAVAVYAAILRNDDSEVNRLFECSAHSRELKQAFLGIGKALDIYNRFVGQTTQDVLMVLCMANADMAYAEAWLDAGGAPDDAGYLKKFHEGKALFDTVLKMRGQLEAIRQAAREWCEKIGIPVEIFSIPLASASLAHDRDPKFAEKAPVDEAMLEMVRSLFREVKLRW